MKNKQTKAIKTKHHSKQFYFILEKFWLTKRNS